ncbi:hypothetical protein ACF0H5_011477 [Mactra antiquata]
MTPLSVPSSDKPVKYKSMFTKSKGVQKNNGITDFLHDGQNAVNIQWYEQIRLLQDEDMGDNDDDNDGPISNDDNNDCKIELYLRHRQTTKFGQDDQNLL